MRLNISLDVQYITCDQNCVISAGLISDNVNSICNAVRKASSSCKPFDVELSRLSMLAGVVGILARENVCRSDDRVFGVAGGELMDWTDGDGGRARRSGGGDDIPLRMEAFFLVLNGRRNDQSDSN